MSQITESTDSTSLQQTTILPCDTTLQHCSKIDIR